MESLTGLTAEELEEFKRTTLYEHHFSTGEIVWQTTISELTLDTTTIFDIDMLTYNVIDWNGEISTKSIGKTGLIGCIKAYLDGIIDYSTDSDDEYEFILDPRYFNGLPDLFIALNDDCDWAYRDYASWLAQGNKPRFMQICNNTEDNYNIPDHVIYLRIICECEYYDDEQCNPLVISQQILFLETNCVFPIDEKLFIGFNRLVIDMDGSIMLDRVPMKEFREYARPNMTKSARTSYQH